MEFSLAHLLIVLLVVLVVFGAGKLPKVMGDLGKGVRSFKEGLGDPEQPVTAEKAAAVPPPVLSHQLTPPPVEAEQLNDPKQAADQPRA